jgi:hypothetical protein
VEHGNVGGRSGAAPQDRFDGSGLEADIVRLDAEAELQSGSEIAAMLAVISPAKTLDYKRPSARRSPPTRPASRRRGALAAAAAKLSAKKLGELMHISDSLAEAQRRALPRLRRAPERPAIYAFAGDVYAGFEVHSLDEEAVLFAQDHLRILSGLYGLLRPLDAIRPYRLEMGTKWAPRRKDLYAFWGDRIAERCGGLGGERQAGRSSTSPARNIGRRAEGQAARGTGDRDRLSRGRAPAACASTPSPPSAPAA